MNEPASPSRARPSSLVHVVWELTLACDLGCKHCGSRAGKPRGDELSTREALDVVAQLAAMGAKEVSLIGGEAYLRDDWHVIARAIRDAGMIASMVTGGRGFTKERARKAAEAGIDSISLSIDGLREAHDHQRGLAGSFDSAVAALRNLREAGVSVSGNSQLNRLSFPDLDGVLDLLIEHGCHGWQLAMTVPMGRAADRPDWLFQPVDLLQVFPVLARLAARGRASGLRLYPGNNVGYFGPHEHALRGALTEMTAGAHWDGCNAGVAGLGIEADGAIKGCPSLPTADYTGGNVRSRPIARIWEEAAELTWNRTGRTTELWGYCAACYYKDICKGGCSWTAHVFFGRRGNNPYCHHRALEMQRRGVRERLVPVTAAPGTPFDHGLFDLHEEPIETPSEPWPTLPGTPARRLPILG
ncbi:MAG: radical SAM protein [Polyangiaceae bacterium]